MVNTFLKIWQKTTTATTNIVRKAYRSYYLAHYRKSLPTQLRSRPICLSLPSSWTPGPAQPSAPGLLTQQLELIPPPKGKPIELTAFSQLEEELFPRSFLSFPLLTSLGFHYVLWNGGGPPQAVGTRFSARYPKVEHSCENVHKPKWPSKEAITSIRMEKMVTIPRHEKAASLRFF